MQEGHPSDRRRSVVPEGADGHKQWLSQAALSMVVSALIGVSGAPSSASLPPPPASRPSSSVTTSRQCLPASPLPSAVNRGPHTVHRLPSAGCRKPLSAPRSPSAAGCYRQEAERVASHGCSIPLAGRAISCTWLWPCSSPFLVTVWLRIYVAVNTWSPIHDLLNRQYRKDDTQALAAKLSVTFPAPHRYLP